MYEKYMTFLQSTSQKFIFETASIHNRLRASTNRHVAKLGISFPNDVPPSALILIVNLLSISNATFRIDAHKQFLA